MPGVLMYAGGNGSSLDGAGLISSLILISLIRILALTGGIYRSDPDCPIGRQPCFFPQLLAPKRGVLHFLVYSLTSDTPDG